MILNSRDTWLIAMATREWIRDNETMRGTPMFAQMEALLKRAEEHLPQ